MYSNRTLIEFTVVQPCGTLTYVWLPSLSYILHEAIMLIIMCIDGAGSSSNQFRGGFCTAGVGAHISQVQYVWVSEVIKFC